MPEDVTLRPVTYPDDCMVLYWILKHRPAESSISHRAMPTYAAHCDFVKHHPYRVWYLIQLGLRTIGEINAGEGNDVGLHLLTEYRGKGYGSEAVKALMRMHEPLPGIPSKRPGTWIAHIALKNESSKRFFARLGFVPVEETWRAQEPAPPSV